MEKRYNKLSIFWFLIALIILFQGCQDRVWDNPFDSECPKELFTPSSFMVSLEGTSVKLSWKQDNLHISGFEIFRSVEGGVKTSVATPGKTETSWVDDKTTPGKVHEYYIVARARSNMSNEKTISMTVPAQPSTIFTEPSFKVYATKALIGGKVISDGGSDVQAKGICWHTSPNPTINNSKTNEGTGVGSFISTLTGLTANTTYYARTYSTTSIGTSYGGQITFKTYYGEVTDIDGNIYPITKIGEQVWMAENLKVTKYNDGTAIPNITDDASWIGLTTGAYCWYNNDISNKETYGALYNWYSVNTNLLAPEGWHVPTYDELKELDSFLGLSGGGKLKETGTIHWASPNTGATNETGFNGIPGGYRGFNGSFQGIGTHGRWYSTAGRETHGRGMEVGYNYDFITLGNSPKYTGRSIRCIKGTPTLATISTDEVQVITTTSATSGGKIAKDGGSVIVDYGVCWSIYPNPDITNNKTSDIAIEGAFTTGVGSFTSSITGLLPNTTYYLRAYVTNNVGTAYGSEISFKTPQTVNLATITTDNAIDISANNVVLGGNVINDGNGHVIERGVVFSISPQPTIESTKITIGSGKGSYSIRIGGLNANTIYYVRAYAINSYGTAYGAEISFTTKDEAIQTISDIEGNKYRIIQIGNQFWMAENLKTTKYNDGTDIPNVTDIEEWANITSGIYAWYDNEIINKTKYGALYNWHAVNTGKLCPIGWHVPSDSDWETLSNYLGGNEVSGGKLKETGFLNWTSPNIGATNESNFTALPSGYKMNGGGNFMEKGLAAPWWSSTSNSNGIITRSVRHNYNSLHVGNYYETGGFCVRCIQDESK